MAPGYLDLYRNGELARRAEALTARLTHCDICPRNCAVDRLNGETEYCGIGARAVVANACHHHGEEPPISGSRGSGTIFFAGCNLRCVYCQNHQISQDWRPLPETDTAALARVMLDLQARGCQNINFVTPSHVAPQIVAALLLAVPLGLNLPLVYNSSGYDALETLRALDGIIDVYLPDLRYAAGDAAAKYSDAADYPAVARAAVREMYRQVGNLKMDEDGVAVRGVIVRHLILPGGLSGSYQTLRFLAEEISPQITLSVMSQYGPQHRATAHPEIARQLEQGEYAAVVEWLDEFGLENGWLQEMASADHYLPDFAAVDHPFERE
jgi:putative pyruvate formate lyase activating enzyme